MMRLIFAVVVTIWAVIGFFLWIPLLVRATTVFSAMIVHAVITGQKPDALRSHLESACGFYSEGFRIAFDVIHNPTNGQPQKLDVRFWQVFGECLWTLAFWIFILMIFHPSLLESPWAVITSISKWWLYLTGALLIFVTGVGLGWNMRSKKAETEIEFERKRSRGLSL